MGYLNITSGVDFNGANPAAKAAMEAAGEAFYTKYGRPMRVVSANRTYGQQAQLYKNKGPGWAAKPGTSRHEKGTAFDVAREDAALADKSGILAQFGLSRPLVNAKKPEPWHVEYTGQPTASVPQQIQQIDPVQQQQQPQQAQTMMPVFQDYYGQMGEQNTVASAPTMTTPLFLQNKLSNPLYNNLFNSI